MKKTLFLLTAVMVSLVMTAQEKIRLAPFGEDNRLEDRQELFDYALQKHGAARNTVRQASSTSDYVTEQPEGELRTYVRTGDNLISILGGIVDGTQNGQTMKVIFAPDGKTVWFYEIVSSASSCFGWIKGEFNDAKDRITIAEGQKAWYYYDGTYYTAYTVCRIEPNPEGSAENYDNYKYKPGEIVFSYASDGTMKLLPDENGVAAIGLIRDSDDPFIVEYGLNGKWLGYGDVNTTYIPFTEQFNQAPDETLERQEFSLMYDVDTEGGRTGRIVNVVFDGGRIYVQGVFSLMPEAWLIGEVSGDKAVFRTHQQLGVYAGHYVFFEGGTYTTVTDSSTGEEYWELAAADEVVLDFDKDNLVLSAEGICLALSGGYDIFLLVEGIVEPVFRQFVDVAAVPDQPVIVDFMPYSSDYYCAGVTVYMPLVDVEGNFLDPSKLSLGLFVNDEPFVFTSDQYWSLPSFGMEEMERIPYGFTDGYDFVQTGVGNIEIRLYREDIQKIGVRSYYQGGGTETESAMSVLVATGIETIKPEDVRKVVYYDLTGRQVVNPSGGLFIKTIVSKDGRRQSMKVVK